MIIAKFVVKIIIKMTSVRFKFFSTLTVFMSQNTSYDKMMMVKIERKRGEVMLLEEMIYINMIY